MKQITRNIDFAAARDLLERVPRACITFASADGPYAHPVTLQWRDDRYLIGLPHSAEHPIDGQEIVLLVDEGVYFFDLRAIYIRGSVHAIAAPADSPINAHWFELFPVKIVAWDYGTLHEVNDDQA